jgi:hypothetical protein
MQGQEQSVIEAFMLAGCLFTDELKIPFTTSFRVRGGRIDSFARRRGDAQRPRCDGPEQFAATLGVRLFGSCKKTLRCDFASVEYRTDEKESNWDRSFAIPASGVAFGSGGAMIGTAVAGPIGGFIGGAVGVASGAVVEIISQKRHEKEKQGE